MWHFFVHDVKKTVRLSVHWRFIGVKAFVSVGVPEGVGVRKENL